MDRYKFEVGYSEGDTISILNDVMYPLLTTT